MYKIEIKKILQMRVKGKTLDEIAQETGHSKNTVIKYLKKNKTVTPERHWTTRKSPFEEIKEEIEEAFRTNPSLQAKALFEHLSEKYPEKFQEGQLRSLQRYLKILRVTIGSDREVTFPQEHRPGELSSSDFTNMNSLRVTLEGEPFNHLLYHFVLTYSNWEWGRICYSETLESLRAGLKECLLQLGGVPSEHLTDNLSAAVHNICTPGAFKDRYAEILTAFQMKGRTIQPSCPNENGDIEQRHYRLKQAIEQALMLRGSRNFANKSDYEAFLHKLLYKLNRTRQNRINEELAFLRPLPTDLISDYSQETARVSSCSTIRVRNCSYSVPSRLIGEEVEVRVYDNKIEVWYAKKLLFETERLRGQNKHRIDYRHIIDSLKRKPGAFKSYRYREDLYPTSAFKVIYEYFLAKDPLRATKTYLEILSMAASNGQDRVEDVLQVLLKSDDPIELEEIKHLVESDKTFDKTSISILAPDLSMYDVAFGLGGNAC